MKPTLVYRSHFGSVTETFESKKVSEVIVDPRWNVRRVREYIKGANHQLEDRRKEVEALGYTIVRVNFGRNA